MQRSSQALKSPSSNVQGKECCEFLPAAEEKIHWEHSEHRDKKLHSFSDWFILRKAKYINPTVNFWHVVPNAKC
jgi:hypothetical protein